MKLIRNVLYLFYRPLNKLKLWMFKVETGTITINGSLFITSKGKVRIGNKAKINSDKFKNVIGGDTRSSIVVRKNACLTIGENLRMSNSAIFCTDKITIGNNVMIGGSCKIWDTDFHPIDPDVRLRTPNDNFKTAPVTIGDNVFLGGFSIILKGVTIGDNSVVGAGSVVTRSIPPNQIWGGNPASFIKTLKTKEPQFEYATAL